MKIFAIQPMLACALAILLLSSIQFAHAATTVTGFTPGSFNVSETGAASYSIPIQAPPGTAGMEPKLSLSYSSQGGNGLLGMGWSMGGLSAITRCPQTMAQDGVRGGVNYDSNDRYCLDGQRLIAISGTYGADGAEYRTERESFSKIISYGTAGNGASYLKAWTKSGQIVEFGNTADSKVEAQGKTTVRVWALSKITDTKGNYLTVTYTEDTTNGDFRPARIDYTGNSAASLTPSQSVEFLYGDRADIIPAYIAGSIIKTLKRLINIHTKVGGALVRDYRLTYDNSGAGGRSRARSVVECDGAGNCLPPTSLDYANASGLSWGQISGLSGWGPGSGFTNANIYPIITGDWNGDGRTDFARVQSGQITFFVSTGTGFTGYYGLDGWGPGNGFTDANIYPIITGDWNGDGRTDFARVQSGQITFFVSTGTGFTGYYGLDGWGPGNGFTDANVYPIITGDWNGDGRTDFARVQSGQITFFVSTGTGFTGYYGLDGWGPGNGFTDGNVYPIITGDWNGDGRTDFARVHAAGISFFVSTATGFTLLYDLPGWGTSTGFTNGNDYPLITGDWNGDGRTDFARVHAAGISFFMSTGTGFTFLYDLPGWGTSTGFTNGNDYPLITGDWNGDGRTDFARVHAAGIGFFVSTGTGFTSLYDLPGWGTGNGFTNGSVYPLSVGDWNGDGKTDFGRVQSAEASFFVETNVFPDNLTSIATGLGASTTLVHKPLTDNSVYTKDTTATYPTLDFKGPVYVVSSTKTSDGIGGNYPMSYAYTGAKLDLNGRGFLGFRIVQSTDPLGLKSISTFRQDWPYVGLPSQTKKTTSGGAMLSQVDNTFACKDFDADPDTCTVVAGKRYFPFASQSVESGNDLNGAALPTVTTTNTFDSFGNATSIVVSTTGGFSKTTTNTFTNDTTNWLLGRLTRSTVTSVTP